MTWPPRVLKGYPKGSKITPWDVILRVRGEYLRWFPPYMKKVPPGAGSGAVCNLTGPSNIDDSYVFWTHLEQSGGSVLGILEEGAPNSFLEVILEG